MIRTTRSYTSTFEVSDLGELVHDLINTTHSCTFTFLITDLGKLVHDPPLGKDSTAYFVLYHDGNNVSLTYHGDWNANETSPFTTIEDLIAAHLAPGATAIMWSHTEKDFDSVTSYTAVSRDGSVTVTSSQITETLTRTVNQQEHLFLVSIEGCTAQQAQQVLNERLLPEEDYGFDYQINQAQAIKAQ